MALKQPAQGANGGSEGGGSSFTVDRAVRLVFGGAILAVVVWLLWYFAALVIYLAAGMLLAYLLSPLVDRVQGTGLGRVPAILLVFVVVLGAISLLLTYLIPFIATQVAGLKNTISMDLIVQVAESVESFSGGVIQAEAITGTLNRALGALFQDEQISRTLDSLVDLFTDLFYAVLVIPFVTFFVLKDGTRFRQNIYWFVPNRHFEITLALMEKVELNVGRYFRALLLQCLSVAAVATVLLLIVGLDFALAVGVFTGLANMIPYLGPLMGFLAGTVVSVAQTGDASLIPGVLVAMALTQIADNAFFQPLIFARAARAHPLIILFVVLVGAQVAGIVGMLLAIPITATLRVTVSQLLWSTRNYRILRAG